MNTLDPKTDEIVPRLQIGHGSRRFDYGGMVKLGVPRSTHVNDG